MKKMILMRRTGASVALILWALGTMPCRAQTPAEPEFARAEESVAALAKKASELRSLPQGPDVPGIRETVRRLEIHVSRTCVGTAPRYALKPVAPDLGPSLPAYADSLTPWYFYPNEAGLRLDFAGDGPGAALSIGSAERALHALGTIAHEEPVPSVLLGPGPARDGDRGRGHDIGAPRTGFFAPPATKTRSMVSG